ncbi:CarD family transcriptional regulator [Neobacillus sp. LXY-4]|uniref:CarD family transcriptional regulator n=1 Tax=Neobacillus sp. LXY-4 TaxID=3379826 RepID=UPI003EE1DC6A
MFNIGDNVVYPMQGAGVIEAIEDKEVLGKMQKYYVIKMPISNMQIMIPMAKAESSRMRMVVDKPALENILDIFFNGESDRSLSWKERYKTNMEKMKTGEMQDGAEVVRDLMRMNKEKTLNSSERQMLENARRIFISELGLVKGITDIQALDFLNEKISS